MVAFPAIASAEMVGSSTQSLSSQTYLSVPPTAVSSASIPTQTAWTIQVVVGTAHLVLLHNVLVGISSRLHELPVGILSRRRILDLVVSSAVQLSVEESS